MFVEYFVQIPLKALMTHSHVCQSICDMIVQMSEYSLMAKYSLLVWHALMPYSIIDRRYIDTGNLSCLSLFLFVSI